MRAKSTMVVGRFTSNTGDLQRCTPAQASFSLPLHFLLCVFHTEKIQINLIFIFFLPGKYWERAKKAVLSLKAFPREENALVPNFEKAKPTEMVDGLRTTGSLNGCFFLQHALFPQGWVWEKSEIWHQEYLQERPVEIPVNFMAFLLSNSWL